MDLKKWDALFYGCPGATFGNMPTRIYSGCIVVDAGKIEHALKYLRRKKVPIAGTRVHGADGITITIPFQKEEQNGG